MVNGTVTVDPSTVTGHVGPRFVGFSYEKTHLTNGSLSGSNAAMIALYNLIGPVVLRVGANDVERCSWNASQPIKPGGQPFGFSIGTAMVDALGDFLNATNANMVYGINFSLNNPSNDADEATYAFPKLGSHFIAFEIGNELDKYGAWTAEKSQWEGIESAVASAVPGALFAGVAATQGGSASFNVPFANDESANIGSKLVLLTQHYYLGGSGTTTSTVTTMQTIKSDIPTVAQTMNGAATNNNIPMGYRFGEANSFYNHGQPGVSDALIASLWSIDLMFTLAQNGGSGINFHGGETGQDGTKPFSYTPILESGGVVQGVQPIYDGMLAFYLAGQGDVLSTNVSTSNPNFTAYTLNYTADGSRMVMLNNKNANNGVQVTVDLGAPVTSASAIYIQGSPAGLLTAPASSVTVAGAGVTAQGTWARNPPFTQQTSGNTVSVFVPPASAALVRVQ
jgi:hypothetical protein